MKKISLLLAVILVFSVLAVAINAATLANNSTLPMSTKAPELDGTIDENEWDDGVVIDVESDDLLYFYTNETTQDEGYQTKADQQGRQQTVIEDSKIYVKTDANGIYFAFDIADTSIGWSYCKTSGSGSKLDAHGGDGVSVTFKPDNEEVHGDTEAIRISFMPFMDSAMHKRTEKMGVFEDFFYQGDAAGCEDLTYIVEAYSSVNEFGYQIEAYVEWETIGELGFELPEIKAGNQLFLNFSIHDAQDTRDDQVNKYWGCFDIPVHSNYAVLTPGTQGNFKIVDRGQHAFISFVEDSGEVITFAQSFVDVPSNNPYYNAVMWAVGQGITNGASDTTFEPNSSCTRGQIVTFLWRAAGCPVPSSTSHNFVDLKKGEYYEQAVLWAVNEGITNGVDATHFDPDATCTRAEALTFLWRFLGKETPTSTSHNFVDVVAGEWYMNAILWGVENGVTNGTDATHFSPDEECTRAQIVTFIYRALKNSQPV